MTPKRIIIKDQTAIPLGMQGDGDVREIVFSVPEDLVGKTWIALHQRATDPEPYPVALRQEGNCLIWTVSTADTDVAGQGRFQLTCREGDQVLKMIVYRTVVVASLSAPGEAPDPVKPWYDSIMERLDALDGVSQEEITAAVDAYFDKNPIESGATSEQVRRIEENAEAIEELKQAIPTRTSELENDSGFLTEHQSLDELVKSVNGVAPDERGNVDVLPGYSDAENGKVLGIVDGTLAWVDAELSDSPESTTHSVTWNLTNVTSSNEVTSASAGASLVAVLTPADGYTLGDVSVTMGGTVLTDVWNGDTSTLTIHAVTGDVEIACVGVESTVETADTTAVIASEGYSIANATGDTTATAGYGITKVYEFSYDVDALKKSTKYDSENDYLTGPAMGGFVVSITNTNYLASGSASTNNNKHRFTADGEYIGWASNPTSGGKISITLKNSKILNASVVGVEFSIPLADIDDTYAYWVSPNPASCPTVFPNGYREGDIVFAGKNTEYYGLANIDGTLAGEVSATALSVDDDIAQNYSIATMSILGEETVTDTSTAYGLSSDLAAVIDEVRTAWMIEYGGDYRKIPIIVSTDQHGRRNGGIFKMLGKTLSMHDVSKIMNLGDTVATEWIDADSEHPLLTDNTLEAWAESISAIPFSKRLDVFGNHDTWYYDGYSVDGNAIGTRYPSSQAHLNQYFRNIYARRTNNNGWFSVKDDQFNVKYVVVSMYEYQGGSGSAEIRMAQMAWLIEELSKNDGYDIVIVSHEPFYIDPDGYDSPTGCTNTETLNRSIFATVLSARKRLSAGTVTDTDGVTHDYDFTQCVSPVLCSLHGHMHADLYQYLDGGLLQNTFDWFDKNTFFFVLIDRANNQLNIWKVEGDSMKWTNYQIPLDSSMIL